MAGQARQVALATVRSIREYEGHVKELCGDGPSWSPFPFTLLRGIPARDMVGYKNGYNVISHARSPLSKLRSIGLATATIICVVAEVSADEARRLPLEQIRLPKGFTIRLYAGGTPAARSLAFSPNGTLFVGTRREAGRVYAVVDRNGDHVADQVFVVVEGLNMPNGVAFRDGALYVAEINRILRFDAIEEHLDRPPTPVIVRDDLPTDRHHGWKFIAFGPDGMFYVPIGALLQRL